MESMAAQPNETLALQCIHSEGAVYAIGSLTFDGYEFHLFFLLHRQSGLILLCPMSNPF